jgi:DNA-binding transcriptional regulator YhcF (GntR family)
MASAQSDLNALEAELLDAKWRVRRTGSHRLAFPPGGGKPVSFSSTPSGHKWRRQLVAQLAVHGFEWNPGGANYKKPTGRRPVLAVHSTVDTVAAELAAHSQEEDTSMAEPATTPSPAQVFGGATAAPTLTAVPDVESTPRAQSKAEKEVERIYLGVLERIVSGDLAPGARVPAELALAVEFETTRERVRRAMKRLDEEGLTWIKSRVAGRFVSVPAAATSEVAESPEAVDVQEDAPSPEPVELVEVKVEEPTPVAPTIEAVTVEPAPESDVIAQAREAFNTLSTLMTGLIEAAEKAQAEAAEAWALIQAAEERATAAEGKRDDYEQEVVLARRRAQEAEGKLAQARQFLGNLVAA